MLIHESTTTFTRFLLIFVVQNQKISFLSTKTLLFFSSISFWQGGFKEPPPFNALSIFSRPEITWDAFVADLLQRRSCYLQHSRDLKFKGVLYSLYLSAPQGVSSIAMGNAKCKRDSKRLGVWRGIQDLDLAQLHCAGVTQTNNPTGAEKKPYSGIHLLRPVNHWKIIANQALSVSRIWYHINKHHKYM